jgi:hypothetical protein
MATNYKFTKALFYKEAEEGQIPSNPAAVQTAGIINFSVKDTQQTETNPTIDNNGQASKKDRGKSNFDGNIECKYMGDMMPILVTHVIGDPDTIATTTVSAWQTATAYEKYDASDDTLSIGDIVSHSDGVHMLVCFKAGTSDAIEPDLTGVSIGSKIVDGTAEWIVVKNLTIYTGVSQACLPSIGIEYSGDSSCGGASDVFKKRINGAYLNAMELNKTAGGVIHKYSIPVTARSAKDNTEVDWTSIEDEAGYTQQDMIDFAFKYDDMKVLINGIQPIDTTMFRMTITRNTAYEDAVEINSKVSNTPIMQVEGEMTLKFTKEEYQKAFNNEAAEIKILLGNARGELAHFTFNNVERDRVDPDFTTERFAEITVPLTADGNNSYRTVDYKVQSQINYQ